MDKNSLQTRPDGYRRIIHVDMDCFYAAVEQRDNPSLRGRPIAVGHDTPRGVVATASYEARKFGVHSAMPVMRARVLCPSLTIVPPRFNVYKEVSAAIQDIFHEYTDAVEPLSLDEAYLDVTANKPAIPLAVVIARQIKVKIKERLSLTSSAGVSYNKFLAKIASDWRKPDGLYTIHPARAADFIKHIPIEKFWGVGPVTARKMHELGVTDGATLAKLSLPALNKYFGKTGLTFYNFARGIDHRPVVSKHIRKTVSCETTLQTDTDDSAILMEIIANLADDLQRRVERSNFQGRTFTLKIKYSDFRQRTRSHTYASVLKNKEEFIEAAKPLLKTLTSDRQSVRLAGIGVSSNSTSDRDLPVYGQPALDFGDFSFDDEMVDSNQNVK